MRALYLQDGQLSLPGDYPRPEVGADDALIRVALAGICSTDLELVKGYAGGFRGVLGHEFVGVVEACLLYTSRRVTWWRYGYFRKLTADYADFAD